MSLYGDLTDVLTPYANKIKELDESLQTITEVIEGTGQEHDSSGDDYVPGLYLSTGTATPKANTTDTSGAGVYYFALDEGVIKFLLTLRGTNTRCRYVLCNNSLSDLTGMTGSSLNLSGVGYEFDSTLPTSLEIVNTGGTYSALIFYGGSNAEASLRIPGSGTGGVATREELDELSATVAGIKQYPLVGSPVPYASELIESQVIDTMTASDVYAIYDTLVTNYPDWIERAEDIGNDANGNAIRHYVVRLTNSLISTDESGSGWIETESVVSWSSDYDHRSILINAGTHGDEKSSVYGVALLVKDIVEKTDAWAMFIKSNFILHIVPILNVWGFDNTTRNNYADVNINRDFTALTTPEANAIVDLIDAIPNLHFVIDSHNDTYTHPQFVCLNNRKYTTLYIQASLRIGIMLDTFFKSIYSTIKPPYLYTWLSTHATSLQGWLAENGYLGFTIETPRRINDNVGTGQNVFSTVNNANACAIVKSVICNAIQMFGGLSNQIDT